MRDWDTPAYRIAEAVARQRLRDRFPEVELSISCRAGWLPLVERFIVDVRAALPEGARIDGLRVGERMGSLTLGYRRIGPAPLLVLHRGVSDAERRAEEASLRTCEVCGAHGVLRCDAGYFLTRCDDHSEGAQPWHEEDGE